MTLPNTMPDTLPFGLPGPKARAQLQTMLQELVAAVLAIIDTRSVAFSVFGAAWRSGDDPIPNRSGITELGRAGSGRQGDVVAVTNPLREVKMIERILAQPTPLLVQVGDQHVVSLVDKLRRAGRAPIGIRKTDDFDAMLSVGNRSD